MLLNCAFGEDSLRVPWTAKRSNQPILKEISPEYSLEGVMLKLKHKYFGHLMQRTDSLEKTLLLGKIEDRRRRGRQRMRQLDGIPTQWTWVWANSWRWWRTGKPSVLQSMGLQRVRYNWVTEQQRQWWKMPGQEETKVRCLLPCPLSTRSLRHVYIPNQRLQLLFECLFLCLPGF